MSPSTAVTERHRSSRSATGCRRTKATTSPDRRRCRARRRLAGPSAGHRARAPLARRSRLTSEENCVVGTVSRRAGLTLRGLLGCVMVAAGAVACASPQHDTSAAASARADMATVPAGWFVMGDDRAPLADERPAHRVYLSTFAIDRFEVSTAQYGTCVASGACPPPERTSSETRQNYFGNKAFASYPVIGVTYADAVAFCNWRKARLPTEAEWEKAARGTDQRRYPWGNQIDHSFARYTTDSAFETAMPAGFYDG